MLKFIRFDSRLLVHSPIFRIYFIGYLILTAILIPAATITTIRHGHSDSFEVITYLVAILCFIMFYAPMTKKRNAKFHGEYTQIIFTLPITRRKVLTAKYLYLYLLTGLNVLFMFLVFLVTTLFLKEQGIYHIFYEFIAPVAITLVGLGSLYIAIFFITKHNTVVIMTIYFISLFENAILERLNLLSFLQEPRNFILLLIGFPLLTYCVSLVFVTKRTV